MTQHSLELTAQALVARGKGILAADDDAQEMFERFDAMGIPSTKENLHNYWETLFTTPGMNEYISGIILCDEALRRRSASGVPYVKLLENENIIPGMVVDTGFETLPGTSSEFTTLGIDGLAERLNEYLKLGARFSKWRAVIAIGKNIPSPHCIEDNALGLARFASLSQKAGLVPIVEPDVLMDGDHSIERCQDVTETTLESIFKALSDHGVVLEQIVLKPNMVLPGKAHPNKTSATEVATATVSCLRKCVPPAVPGIAFLSGGQSDQASTEHLNAMNAMTDSHPWELSFSFGRALQTRPLKTWGGDPGNAKTAQAAFHFRASLNSAARFGKYNPGMEIEAAIEQPA